jgi:dethiobiotin synthetase
MMATGKVFCITGIDTDIGKTIVTGILGRFLAARGLRVITQKVVQTGCRGMSEDILKHRQIMGCGVLEEDRLGLTCPYVFSTPCSPHLAARLEGKTIEPEVIARATEILQSRYDVVLLEGAGGLLVPLNEGVTFLDYLEKKEYPLILVSSPRLGSINHTLSTMEIVKGRGLHLCGIVYNRFLETDYRITEDSAEVFIRFLRNHGLPECLVDFGRISEKIAEQDIPDFSGLFAGETMDDSHNANMNKAKG